jgi:N utilization substance protein A
MVIVPDYQLSLAIGKEGQNARLAARLTGWRIDIKSETQVADEARAAAATPAQPAPVAEPEAAPPAEPGPEAGAEPGVAAEAEPEPGVQEPPAAEGVDVAVPEVVEEAPRTE